MLRAVSAICFESQSLVLFSPARRDVYKFFRTSSLYAATPNSQTVLTSETSSQQDSSKSGVVPPPYTPPPPPPTPPPAPRRAWTVAAALAITASLGGVYFYRKLNEDEDKPGKPQDQVITNIVKEEIPPPIPATGAELPKHVQYLLVGAGTASFAAMRAIRTARPEAQVLMVGEEREFPYMRPPLSKEIWREPDLALRADLNALSFRQWNGRRRSVAYEPPVFYTPVEQLEGKGQGASVARGWKVVRLDVAKHEAELTAPGQEPVVIQYDKCLVATGVRPRRSEALRTAAAAGRSLALRSVRDVSRLAGELEREGTQRVAVLGGGFLASELSAALADRLCPEGRTVVQVFRESAPMAAVLPHYLAVEAARRLAETGVTLLPEAEVIDSTVNGHRVTMRLASGGSVEADLVVECIGSEVESSLAETSALEVHPDLGGLLVNAELQARSDVYAAGDVACFYDVVLGRRRVEHHDHAVVSGRLAGDNMAALGPAHHYTHQSMFWSDLGPNLGYEAIGIIESRLPTVGVYCADAVTDVVEKQIAIADSSATEDPSTESETVTIESTSTEVPREVLKSTDEATSKRYARGVVLYLRDTRVVGVLLWNLFNRMHIARQVIAQGEFEDLFEVAKLFSLDEDD